MSPSVPGHFKRSFKAEDGAAIEGLPLYLIIITVITVVGIGILLGMMDVVKPVTTIDKVLVEPDVIEVEDSDGDDVYNTSGEEVTIKVVDSNGDPIKGAVVRLSGCNVKSSNSTAYGKTDSNGEAVFDDIECEVIGTDTGHITVEVEKSGLGEAEGQIAVIPVV